MPSPAPKHDDAYLRRLFVFLGVAGFFEGYDNFALTQLLPSIRTEMGLSTTDEGWLVGAIGTGSILAYGLVRLADRWGRRRTLTLTILGYAFFTAITGFTRTGLTFGAAQLCARFFLIAEWSIGMVVAAEEFPAERRGHVLGVLNGLNGLGAIVCAGIAPALTASRLGWRGLYFSGTLPLLLLAFARRSLRETRRFEEHVARTEAIHRPFTRILAHPYRRRMLTLALAWALTYVCTVNGVTFWKEHAIGERGFTDAAVGLYVSIAAVAAMPLSLLSGKLIDRAGRRAGAAVIYACLILGTLGCYMPGPRALALAGLILAMFGITAVGTVLGAYNTELFPTELRADALAWSNHLLGRVSLCAAPPIAGYVAARVGWGKAVSATAVFPTLALVLLLVTMPETRGKELEETAQPG
jgi:putative MFS transporter